MLDFPIMEIDSMNDRVFCPECFPLNWKTDSGCKSKFLTRRFWRGLVSVVCSLQAFIAGAVRHSSICGSAKEASGAKLQTVVTFQYLVGAKCSFSTSSIVEVSFFNATISIDLRTAI